MALDAEVYRLTNPSFKFLGLGIIHTSFTLNGMGVGTAANAKHFGALHATVIDDGNICGTATDVHQDGTDCSVRVVADHGASDGERFGSYGQQIKVQLMRGTLQGTNVHERRKGRIELHHHIAALEADWLVT